MPERDDILVALREMRPSDFIANHCFDRIPFVFTNDRQAFLDWKRDLARRIEVDTACITIVGSSGIGISLNPIKGFKSFDSTSDIDVAIVSNYHFIVAWRYLRSNGHRRPHVDARTLIAWDDHVNRLIYWGTIATDKLLGILPFGEQWLKAVAAMSAHPATRGREIKLRIYADYESLRSYQNNSAKTAREELLTKDN